MTKSKKKQLSPKHYEKKESLHAKLVKLQDLYIDSDISKEDFMQAKNRYELQLSELDAIEEQHKKSNDVFDIYKKGVKKLEGFDNLFNNSDIHRKRQLLGSMFPEKFQIENKSV